MEEPCPHILASRELVLIDEFGVEVRKVHLTVYAPKIIKVYDSEDNVDWQADFAITGLTGPKSQRRGRAMQIDSLGAIIEAMQLLATTVRSTEDYKNRRLFWLEPGDNCGLPIFDGLEYVANARGD